MNPPKKRAAPGMGNGSINTSLSPDKKPNNTTLKLPTKAEVGIQAFLEHGSLNTFEANRAYNDTCLHSFVSFLNRRYGLVFERKFEDVGAKRPVKRYTPTDVPEMRRVLNNLRIARGVGLQHGS